MNLNFNPGPQRTIPPNSPYLFKVDQVLARERPLYSRMWNRRVFVINHFPFRIATGQNGGMPRGRCMTGEPISPSPTRTWNITSGKRPTIGPCQSRCRTIIHRSGRSSGCRVVAPSITS
jgi:hypothetical protein